MRFIGNFGDIFNRYDFKRKCKRRKPRKDTTNHNIRNNNANEC